MVFKSRVGQVFCKKFINEDLGVSPLRTPRHWGISPKVLSQIDPDNRPSILISSPDIAARDNPIPGIVDRIQHLGFGRMSIGRGIPNKLLQRVQVQNSGLACGREGTKGVCVHGVFYRPSEYISNHLEEYSLVYLFLYVVISLYRLRRNVSQDSGSLLHAD